MGRIGKDNKKGLERGDVGLIAKISGYSRKTVGNVLSGRYKNERILKIALELKKQRTARDIEVIQETVRQKEVIQ